MKALVLLALTQVGGVPPESAAVIRREARRVESRFERLSRSMAPFAFTGMTGYNCDEIVGRFCLRFDSNETPAPPSEAAEVTDARRLAITALRRAFGAAPSDFTAAAPLVRYLVEDGRPSEAASTARTYAALAGDSVWGRLLLGFALHAGTEDTAATRLFREAIVRLPEAERLRARRMDWLLSPRDRGLFTDAVGAARDSLERAIWLFSDPLYLTPGNERWNQHIARYVWSRLLERAPIVSEALPWGDDLEELTSRYGVPTSRTRSPSRGLDRGPLVEHYDPAQLAYLPADILTAGFPIAPAPGDDWPLNSERARSVYAPETVRTMEPLEHQLTRFPAGDSIAIRVDAAMPLDSVASGQSSVYAALFLVDGARGIVQSAERELVVHDDTARFVFTLVQDRTSRLAYSAEALEPVTRMAARARYAVPPDTTSSPTLFLSDPLIVHAYGRLDLPTDLESPSVRPHTSLVFAPGDTVGLYAEVRGLAAGPTGQTRYSVRLSLASRERRSILGQVTSWLGRTLGLSRPGVPARLEWEAAGTAGAAQVLAVDLPLTRSEGLYALELEVRDLVRGSLVATERLVRIGS